MKSNQLDPSFVRHMNVYPVLSPAEQLSIWKNYQDSKDPALAHKLVQHNLRLIAKIAFEYKNLSKNIMDLIQEGSCGLILSIAKYDPNQGMSFPSYAVFWIRALILKYLLQNHSMMKIATTDNQRKAFYNLQKEQARLEAQGINPTDELLAKNLGIDESTITEMSARLSYREMLTDSEESVQKWMNDLSANEPSPEDMYFKEQKLSWMRQKIENYGRTLPERKFLILKARYLNDEVETYESIAKKFNLTKQRVHQIDEEIKGRLKVILTTK